MSKRGEVYKCEKCGSIVEVLHESGGTLICCRDEMKRFEENKVDAATEKHIPVVLKIDGGYKVTVGSVDHPMDDEHYIEWIELVAGNEVYRRYLDPGQTPEATFKTDAADAYARAYCNLHGLWKS